MLDSTSTRRLARCRIDRITVDDVNDWYDDAGTGSGVARAQAYSLLRTILGTAASTRPKPLIPFNPAHIRGAGNVKRAHKVEPATPRGARGDRGGASPTGTGSWPSSRLGAPCASVNSRSCAAATSTCGTSGCKIRRGVVRVAASIIVGPPKTDAGIRDVAIPPHLIPAVKAPSRDAHVGTGTRCTALPVVGEQRRHMQPSTLYKVFYPAREVAGRKDLRWHDLRHTGAVLAAQTGATLAELMGRLGHTTPGAAMRYQHAAADRDAEIARRLSELAERSTDV